MRWVGRVASGPPLRLRRVTWSRQRARGSSRGDAPELDEWIGQMRSAVDNIGKGPYSPLMLSLAQQAIDANDLRHA